MYVVDTVVGVGKPRWAGLHQYARLVGDEVFWASFKNSLAMIIAMVVCPPRSA